MSAGLIHIISCFNPISPSHTVKILAMNNHEYDSHGESLLFADMCGGVLIDLEESWLVMVDCTGPRQFWSCSKQSWCYGDSPRFFSS